MEHETRQDRTKARKPSLSDMLEGVLLTVPSARDRNAARYALCDYLVAHGRAKRAVRAMVDGRRADAQNA